MYGELLSGTYTDPVHHETIRERSRRHNWTIRLHRHTSLVQIFLFRTPGVFVQLGDVEHTSTEPLVLIAPCGVPHGFRFSEDVIGDVLSLRVSELPPDIVARLDEFESSTCILTESGMRYFRPVDDLIRQLRSIYHDMGSERSALMASLAGLIVMYLSADLRGHDHAGALSRSEQRTRSEMQMERFCKLVEGNFDKAWTVGDYAQAVGISAPHLTRLSRRILGVSPNELVRQRRLLEAKRLLEYTRLSIAEIAHRSGFRDAAFFSRSFKNLVGMSPQKYRAARDG